MTTKRKLLIACLFLGIFGFGFQIVNGGGGGGITCGSPTCTVSTAGAGSAVLALSGNTSGTATFTAPAIAGTATNAVTSSNWLSAPLYQSSGTPGGSCSAPAAGLALTADGSSGVFAFGSNAVDICANNNDALQIFATFVNVKGTNNFGFNGGKGQHFQNQAATSDMAGVASGTTTTATVSFTTNYTSTPACVVTPTTAGVTSFIITSQSNSGFTITYAPSASTTFNYVCIGNPN